MQARPTGSRVAVECGFGLQAGDSVRDAVRISLDVAKLPHLVSARAVKTIDRFLELFESVLLVFLIVLKLIKLLVMRLRVIHEVIDACQEFIQDILLIGLIGHDTDPLVKILWPKSKARLSLQKTRGRTHGACRPASHPSAAERHAILCIANQIASRIAIP